MKKSTLALSIAAAIGGLGFAGQVLAAAPVAGTATSMSVNADGVGHQLVFPYFTAQGDNATLLSITNTDTTNGKLVKVRFRGAGNSDDLFDFTLALSPGDMWTASVSKDATTGLAKLATSDTSCTLPYSVNSVFGTQRIDPSSADKANETREGYVEVINMADILPLGTVPSTVAATALFTAIKHVSAKAPCTSTVLQAKLGGTLSGSNLYTAVTATTGANGDTVGGLANPTTGLTGDWIILNQSKTAAWSGSATALQANGSGNQVFSVQKDTTTGVDLAWTADPLLTSGVVVAKAYDLPDLSTPYTSADASAVARADSTTGLLAVKSVSNQYVTTTGIAAVTDFLFAQPTRRYHVAVNYTAKADDLTTTANELDNLSKTGAKAVAVYRDTTGMVAGGASTYYPSTIMGFQGTGRNLCLKDVISVPAKNTIFDREETTPASAAGTDFVISPQTPSSVASVYVCGEAAVLSINNGGATGASALNASVARNDITSADIAKYSEGWMTFNTTGAGSGLPILGASFIRAANGSVNYGFTYGHKVTR